MRSVYKTKRPGGIWEKVNLDLSLATVNWAEFQNTCGGLYRVKCIPYAWAHPTPTPTEKAEMGFDGQSIEEIAKRR